MILITDDYLNSHRTERGAWTKSQFKVIGVPWPPIAGWKSVVLGRELTDEQAKAFEAGKTVFSKTTLRDHAKQEIAKLEFLSLPIPEELRAAAMPVPNIPPTNPKSIRRAEKKKARKLAKQKARKAAAVAFVVEAEKVGYQQAKKNAGDKKKRHKAPRDWKPLTRVNPASDAFLTTYEWRRVRMMALKQYGARCQCCGATPATGAVMNVDHIKPRKLFPYLALDISNLQVLCHECNHGKGNWDMTDWRDAEDDPDSIRILRSL